MSENPVDSELAAKTYPIRSTRAKSATPKEQSPVVTPKNPITPKTPKTPKAVTSPAKTLKPKAGGAAIVRGDGGEELHLEDATVPGGDVELGEGSGTTSAKTRALPKRQRGKSSGSSTTAMTPTTRTPRARPKKVTKTAEASVSSTHNDDGANAAGGPSSQSSMVTSPSNSPMKGISEIGIKDAVIMAEVLTGTSNQDYGMVMFPPSPQQERNGNRYLYRQHSHHHPTPDDSSRSSTVVSEVKR